MTRDLERRTLELVAAALRRTMWSGTPAWLVRPGRDEAGPAWRKIRLIYRRLTDGLELPIAMPPRESRVVDGLIGGRGLSFRVIEVDESQHFNPHRALTLRLYDRDAPLAFPRKTWLNAAENGREPRGGGWAAPKPPLFPMAGGRNRQRAFRDALADLLPPLHDYAPTLRIADFEVRGWLYDRGAVARMKRLLEERMESTPSANPRVIDD